MHCKMLVESNKVVGSIMERPGIIVVRGTSGSDRFRNAVRTKGTRTSDVVFDALMDFR